jgi:hypothetical protein
MMSLKLWIRHTSQEWKVKTHAYATTWLGCTAKYCVIHVSVDMRSVFDSLVTPLSQISYCVCAELIHPYIQQRKEMSFNGSITVKVVLTPASLSTAILPLCKSTAFLTIARPSPVPWIVPTLLARSNDTNS